MHNKRVNLSRRALLGSVKIELLLMQVLKGLQLTTKCERETKKNQIIIKSRRPFSRVNPFFLHPFYHQHSITLSDKPCEEKIKFNSVFLCHSRRRKRQRKIYINLNLFCLLTQIFSICRMRDLKTGDFFCSIHLRLNFQRRPSMDAAVFRGKTDCLLLFTMRETKNYMSAEGLVWMDEGASNFFPSLFYGINRLIVELYWSSFVSFLSSLIRPHFVAKTLFSLSFLFSTIFSSLFVYPFCSI